MDDDVVELRKEVSDLSTEVAVLASEARSHITESAETTQLFFDKVMDTEHGIIVKHARLDERVKALETARTVQKENRDFWRRQVIIMAIVAPVIVGITIGIMLWLLPSR